ncbi:MAG: hypothetical protein BroJett025_04110 [Patescibacteria group bacterium]|nr:MAG: hypothetical protein BroJett025_04110 [Patescibacteria group bacterium]
MLPLTYLLFPNHIITFLIAMGIWGIYYELNLFSSFHFVHSYARLHEHSKTWGLIQAFQSSAYALAPIIVVQLLSFGYSINFILVCLLLAVAIVLSLIFKKKFVKNRFNADTQVPIKKSWTTEFRIWKLLLPKVWPLLLLEVALTTIDAGFWTIGTLLSQELSETSKLGSLFITAYIAPAILVGFALGKLNLDTGKKKIALISSAIAGLFLSGFHFIESIPVLLFLTAMTSLFMGAAIPELKATFEDYVSRLKDKSNEMIGLQGSSTSLAYVIGPIIATFLASQTGYKASFSILGVTLAVIAVTLLFVVPHKIKMPQKELEHA